MEPVLTEFDKRANEVYKLQQKAVEQKLKLSQNEYDLIRANILTDMKGGVRQLDAIRAGSMTQAPVDLSFAEFVQDKWGFAPDSNGNPESFYQALRFNPGGTTLQSLMTMPDFDEGFRWLIVEIIRESIRLGLRKDPLYPNIIAAEQNVTMPGVTMPYINMADAMPSKVGEAETIPVGTMSFGQKKVNLTKVAVGMRVSDEVRDYVPINVLGLFMQDMGVKLNLALDAMAIDVLINGETGNNNAAPVVGVLSTTNGITYQDLLKAWIRMTTLGRKPQSLLSNESIAETILMMTQFNSTIALLPGITNKLINLRTPLPSAQAYDVHGAFTSTNQVMLIDATSALIKLNSQALRVESDRIAEKQISGTYASLTTGFVNMFRDARLIIDQSVTLASQGYPSWMDVYGYQQAQVFNS